MTIETAAAQTVVEAEQIADYSLPVYDVEKLTWFWKEPAYGARNEQQ